MNNTSVFVSSNGLLTFGTGNTTFTNENLTTTPAQASIAPFWDDLHTAGGVTGSNVFFQVSGAGLDQHLTIQWNNIRFFAGGTAGDTLTFQAQLFADGRVQFNYQDLASAGAAGNNGASATVGIKASGTQGPNRLLLAFNNGPNAFVGTGLSTLISQPPGDDWYSFNVTGAEPINLSTSTPADGPGEFVNALAPGLELYDPSGALVASGTTLPDGRNQEIAGYVPLSMGDYRVRVMGRDGTRGEYALGGNLGPVITAISLDATSIDENGSVTLTGSFTDPDALDTHQVVINWGPGETPTTIDLAAGVNSFSVTHQYLDDNPTATVADLYTINVTVSDSHGGSASASTDVTVNNVNPAVNPIGGPSPGPAARGQSVGFSGAFSDVGTLDTHEVSWNFGDGSVIPFHPSTDPGALTPSHVYTAAGSYTVTLSVRDDDGGLTEVTKTVTVVPISLQDDPLNPGQPMLVVGGTTGNDLIRFTPWFNNTLIATVISPVWTSSGLSVEAFVAIVRPTPTGFEGSYTYTCGNVTLNLGVVNFPTTASSLSRLVAYGQAGCDDIEVAGHSLARGVALRRRRRRRHQGGSGPESPVRRRRPR